MPTALWLCAAVMLVPTAFAQSAPSPTEVRFPVADVYRTAAGPAAPAILLFHQGGGNARGEYRAIVPRLLGEGYNVLAADIRGGGDRFDERSRAPAVGPEFRYCDAVAEVDAAVDLARARGFTGPLVLWGSSYTATLVLQVAARRPTDVGAVLAFSPASGEPMAGCEPEPVVGRLAGAGVPMLVLRPRRELADSTRAAAFEGMRRDGAGVFVAEQGAHGSSMLDSTRTQASTAPQWQAVLDFLRRSVAPSVRVTYLANEGVMLEGSRGRVLLDALFGDGLPDYAVVPKPSRDSLETAQAGYGGAALVLATHPHRDHYDSTAVARYLRHNPKAVALGPSGTGLRVPAPVDLGWVSARPIAIPHGPTRRAVDHTAWLVTLDGTTALHIGDAGSDAKSWPSLGLGEKGLDFALVPYWYALDDARFRELLDVLRPRSVVLFHVPVESDDRWKTLSRELPGRYPQVRTTGKELAVIRWQ